MLEIMATGPFKKASTEVLNLASQLIPANTLLVAINDGKTNRIIQVFNRNEVLVEECDVTFAESYSGRVCSQERGSLIIEDTAVHPLTKDLMITKNLGSLSFLGVPVSLRDGRRVASICALNRTPYQFQDFDGQVLQAAAEFLAHVAALERTTYRDSVTNAYTRHYLANVFGRWVRSGTNAIATLVIDVGSVDVFRSLEGFGGSEALQQAIVERLRLCLNPEDLLARLSETEFAVMCKSDERSSHVLASSILKQFREPMTLGSRRYFLWPHIGIAHHSSTVSDGHQLLQQATMAVYLAKTQTQNRIGVFVPEEALQVARRLDIAGRLYQALDRHEFTLAFQPKFRTPSIA